MTEPQYIHEFLRCACGHTIPLPHPTLEATIEVLTAKEKVIRKAVFACTECGLVSAYSSQNVQEMTLPIQDPHRRQELALGYIEPKCDGNNCEAPRRLYMLGSGPETIGMLQMKVRPKDWQFAPSATCEAGHQLFFQKDGQSESYTWIRSDSPL